ncbi:MAG: tetratricopeptide repeat protein [Lysobacter sp.]|nr:tetratricopeptide repeat protein [Lysobacter sp.]
MKDKARRLQRGAYTAAALVLLILLLGCTRAAPSLTPQQIEQERADLASIELMLNRANDHPELIERSRVALDRVLARNPHALDAYYLYSRYHVRRGYQYPDLYDPKSLEDANAVLDKALEISPSYSLAYVQRGGVYIAMRRFDDAQAALDTARRMGSTSPWLDMNQALLLQAQARLHKAAGYCERVISNPASDYRVQRYAYNCLIDFQNMKGNSDEADKLERKLVAVADDDAFTHGNYATHVLCSDDDYERAIFHAESALSVKQYPYARSILAIAYYRKWAAELEAGRLSEAERAWKAARKTDSTPAAYLVATWCDSDSTRKTLIAMRERGEMEHFDQYGIARLARAPVRRSIVGVFEMTVSKGSYGPRGLVFTSDVVGNQRLRIVASTKDALPEDVQRKFGKDVNTAVSGKVIAFIGLMDIASNVANELPAGNEGGAQDLFVKVLDLDTIVVGQ